MCHEYATRLAYSEKNIKDVMGSDISQSFRSPSVAERRRRTKEDKKCVVKTLAPMTFPIVGEVDKVPRAMRI